MYKLHNLNKINKYKSNFSNNFNMFVYITIQYA